MCPSSIKNGDKQKKQICVARFFSFLAAEGAGTHKTHRCMSAVYNKHSMSLTSVCKSGIRDSEKDAHYCKTIRA